MPEKKCLLLTYNARLKSDTRRKQKSFHLEKLEVHSYHAMGYKYYKRQASCAKDDGLIEIVREDAKTKRDGSTSSPTILINPTPLAQDACVL